MGKLTTHVLDIAHGRPADNVTIELFAIDSASQKRLVKTLVTNADGRTDLPLLTDAEFKIGVYELVFSIGAYFSRFEDKPVEVPFLDRIPLQFGISDPTGHYHVPLLASPWAYSTYRGS